MVSLGPVLEITNAFFGAFFGLWLSNYLGTLQDANCGLLAIVFFLTALLLSMSLQILGIASILGLGSRPLARDVAKKSPYNIAALAFFVAPVGIAACSLPDVAFMSSVGLLIYMWWLAVLLVAIIFQG